MYIHTHNFCKISQISIKINFFFIEIFTYSILHISKMKIKKKSVILLNNFETTTATSAFPPADYHFSILKQIFASLFLQTILCSLSIRSSMSKSECDTMRFEKV